MNDSWIRVLLVLTITVPVSVMGQPTLELPQLEVFEGHPVRTVLPPDAIPALDAPAHISAARAGFIDAEDRVLGVVIGGEARAYPLELLDWHEVVNDHLGGLPIAATW